MKPRFQEEISRLGAKKLSMTPEHKRRRGLVKRAFGFFGYWMVLSWFLGWTAVMAAEPSKTPSQASETKQAPQDPVAIADSEIIPRAEQTLKALQKIKSGVAADSTLRSIQAEFAALVKNFDRRRESDAETMRNLRSMQRLNEILREWNIEQRQLEEWDQALTVSSQFLGAQEKDIDRIVETWRATEAAVAKKFLFKAVLQRRVEEVLREAQATRQIVQQQTTKLLKLQSEIADQLSTLAGIRTEIGQVREELGRSLFKLDSPPLWQALFRPEVEGTIEAQPLDGARRLLDDLQGFAQKNVDRIPLHVLLFLSFVALFYFLRRGLTPDTAASEPSATMVILDRAVASGFLLALVSSPLLYPGTGPGILRGASAVTVIPICRLLPGLLPKKYQRWVYLGVALYVLDFLRYLLSQDGLFPRLLLLIIATGGLLGLGRFLHSRKEQLSASSFSKRLVSLALWFIVFLFALSVVSNVIGNLSLADVLVVTPLRIIYIAALIFTAAHLLNTIVALTLQSPAARWLRSVREHSALLVSRCRKLIGLTSIILWLLVSLNISGVLGDVTAAAEAFLQLRWSLGAAEISIQGLAAFFAVLFTAVLISRMTRFVLTEEILPRIRLPRGVPGAVDLLSRYGIILMGFLIALAAAGVDFSKLTLLVSALGVGIGFGLQNVVNNFVSGLILVFEHPVQVGDFVEVGTTFGEVRKIGFRASVLRTPDGADVIIPNSELVGTRFVNWSLYDWLRRISISVNVAYGTDPNRVIEILVGVARKHPAVLSDPAPLAVFDRFGESALGFTLLCWSFVDRVFEARSELTIAINNAFKEAGIEIPFPQQDVHVHWPDAAKSGDGVALQRESTQPKPADVAAILSGSRPAAKK